MNIAAALRDIGKGREGARSLSFADACEVFTALLEGRVVDLQVGAFCAAMRIKGETPEEMAGFLQATRVVQARAGTLVRGCAPVVLPSYNGSRRLPLLTPLLALLLARRGVPVLVHGMATEDARVHAFQVFHLLGLKPAGTAAGPLQPVSAVAGHVSLVHTHALTPGLARLLDVRRVTGLRNTAHSLVKLMNPCAGRAWVVGSYTHPEYAVSMRETFERTRADALLLRGTEGEPVADPRRMPALQAFLGGVAAEALPAQQGPLSELPQLPPADAASTAQWTQAVLDGRLPVPAPLMTQVESILAWRMRLLEQAVAATEPAFRAAKEEAVAATAPAF